MAKSTAAREPHLDSAGYVRPIPFRLDLDARAELDFLVAHMGLGGKVNVIRQLLRAEARKRGFHAGKQGQKKLGKIRPESPK